MDAMAFFQKSSGLWRSQRTTHHLAFKRAEMGGSEIRVQALPKDDPQIIELCQLHEVEPDLAGTAMMAKSTKVKPYSR
jgi:CpeS-like protein